MAVCARIGMQQRSAQQLLVPMNSTEISRLHQGQGVMIPTPTTATTISQEMGRTRKEDFRNRKVSSSAASFFLKYSDDMHNLLNSAAHQHGVSFNSKSRTCCSNNVGADLVVDNGVDSRSSTSGSTTATISEDHPQTIDSDVDKRLLQAGEIIPRHRDRNGRHNSLVEEAEEEMKDVDVIKSSLENGIAAPAKSGRAGEDLQHTTTSVNGFQPKLVGSGADLVGSLESKLQSTSTGFDNNNVSSCSAQEAMKPRFRKKPMSVELAHRWREIQGSQKWEGLLQPVLDSVLGEEVMKYGEFAQATYDAFDNEKNPKYCGSSKFNKEQLLEKMGMAHFGYEVTKYLYATADANIFSKFFSRSKLFPHPWSKDSNRMGFVAVATSEDEIKRLGRRECFSARSSTCTILEARGLGVQGPNSELERTISAVKEEICRLVELYADEELSITITGHSLGGALASLCAFDIAHSKCNERPSRSETDSHEQEESKLESSIPVSLFTFASPRVGNDAFRDRLEELGVNVLCVVNTRDIVPKVPGFLVNESSFDTLGSLEKVVGPWLDRLPWTYTHAGVELKLNQKDSPFVKQKRDYVASHSLELHLHLLDLHGFQSAHPPSQSDLGRDIALVNRYSDSLIDDLKIPSFWWQQENKGMILKEGGLWVQPDRQEDEIPCDEAHDLWL